MNADPKLDLPERILIFTKKLPSHESLFVIQNYNFELREVLHGKQESLKEMEFHRSKAENELKCIEFAIDGVKAETEKVKLMLQKDIDSESKWKEQLKLAEQRKLTSGQHYQAKMAEFRNQLFSNVGINEETVTSEIHEISCKLEHVLSEIDNAKLCLNESMKNFHTILTTNEVEESIQNIQMLRDQILSENEKKQVCERLEIEIDKLTEEMKSVI